MSRISSPWLEGVGLHTGAACRVRVEVEPPGTGIWLHQLGSRAPAFRASPAAVVCSTRRTVLSAGGATVSTVEHVLSALAGLGLWDALVLVEGPEVPALDGSALPFVRALAPLAHGRPRPPPLRLDRPLRLRLGSSEAEARPSDRLYIGCSVSFDHPAIGARRACWRGSRRGYAARVAPARTFGFLEEVGTLRAAGLATGGSLENALVYGPEGPLVPERLRAEAARHKLLDAIGDLALVGRPLAATVRLLRPGHGLTTELARRIAEQARP